MFVEKKAIYSDSDAFEMPTKIQFSSFLSGSFDLLVFLFGSFLNLALADVALPYWKIGYYWRIWLRITC